MGQRESEWISLEEGHALTGFHVETIRSWSRQDPPLVRSKVDGKRRLVNRDDVVDYAATTAPRRRAGATTGSESSSVLDRVATLEEVVRRQRLIDEHREEIERRHLAIAHQYREIAEMVLGPSTVPNF